MLFVVLGVMAGGLTACDAGHMDPMSYGSDAPADINSKNN